MAEEEKEIRGVEAEVVGGSIAGPETREDLPIGAVLISVTSYDLIPIRMRGGTTIECITMRADMGSPVGQRLTGKDIQVRVGIREASELADPGRIRVRILAEARSEEASALVDPRGPRRQSPVGTFETWDPIVNRNYIVLGGPGEQEFDFALCQTHRRVEMYVLDDVPQAVIITQNVHRSQAGFFIQRAKSTDVDSNIVDSPKLIE